MFALYQGRNFWCKVTSFNTNQIVKFIIFIAIIVKKAVFHSKF